MWAMPPLSNYKEKVLYMIFFFFLVYAKGVCSVSSYYLISLFNLVALSMGLFWTVYSQAAVDRKLGDDMQQRSPAGFVAVTW